MSFDQTAKALVTKATLAATTLVPSFAIGTACVVAATVASAPAADAQMTQSDIKVDDKDYTITVMSGLHMVQFDGPEGRAMVSVNNENKITAFIYLAGGPGQKDIVNKVWAAFLARTNGTPDQNAALGGRPAAITPPVQGRATGTSTPAPDGGRVVKSLTADSITIHDPNLNTDVTFTKSLMDATYTVTPQVPAGLPISAKPQYYHVYFEGGESKAGAGAGLAKGVKGTLTGALDSQNHHADATSSITTNTDVWRVKVKEGNTTRDVYESGGSQSRRPYRYGNTQRPGSQPGPEHIGQDQGRSGFCRSRRRGSPEKRAGARVRLEVRPFWTWHRSVDRRA